MKKVLEKRKRTTIKVVTDEFDGIKNLLSKFPSGIFSMVSDTFNIWRMCVDYLPRLKPEIMSRDGKLVIRPDSGNPADIVCGLNTKGLMCCEDEKEHPAYKGVVELLWDVFGGKVNGEGYKVLDDHIGVIYGDSITLEIADEICSRLASKGFASTNVVLGIGSFTYQFNTRDTFGFAMKATYVEIDGIGREIFKDPITDDGMKKSATGLLQVTRDEDGYQLKDKVTWEQENQGELKTIYLDGKLMNSVTLTDIREKLKQS